VEELCLVALACDTGMHKLTHCAARVWHVEAGAEVMQCLLSTLVAGVVHVSEHLPEQRRA
jgi:hypothetical protein